MAWTSTARLFSVALFIATAGVACTTGASPAPPTRADGSVDPVLAQGQSLFESNCASCHGRSGEGGTGPQLADRVADRFPEVADQLDIVRQGPGAMPSFDERLTDEEIEAVVRYTREVL